jgi:hypothetical protein
VVPQDALEAAANADEGATVLLFADEPLVLPVVTLQRGRLVIVSPGASDTRVNGLVSMLVGAPSSESAQSGRERLGSRTWSAERGDTVAITRRGATSAVVPLDDRIRVSPHLVTRARDVLAGSPPFDLAGALGDSAGLVHFSPSPREWIVYWPRTDRPIFIHSPVRLPHVVELGRVAGHAADRVVRMPARSGDVALAASADLGLKLLDVEKLMADGGPGALDRLKNRRAETLHAFVAEVR